jgi:hypothetical protein
MLWHCQMSLHLEGGNELRDELLPVYSDVHEKMVKVIEGSIHDETSAIQAAISTTLSNEMGVEHEVEASPFERVNAELEGSKFLAIDIAIRREGRQKLAVEVQGPSHYNSSGGESNDSGAMNKKNGPTEMKGRLLQRLGWKVVDVPWLDWIKVCKEGRQVEYLERVIGDAR